MARSVERLSAVASRAPTLTPSDPGELLARPLTTQISLSRDGALCRLSVERDGAAVRVIVKLARLGA